MFLARLQLARGDVDAAAAMLVQAEETALQKSFTLRLPDIAAAHVDVLLRQGEVTSAAHLVEKYDLPLSRSRVLLAQGEAAAALTLLSALRHRLEEKAWQDERLKVLVLQAIALQAHGEPAQAVQTLGEALRLAEPGGFIRLFVDEGEPMAHLLSAALSQGIAPGYVARLLAAFPNFAVTATTPSKTKLLEPLSPRELEVLQLVAQGLSNREIAEQLFLALSTVKGYNRTLFGKLQVQRRTQAVARARELGLL